MSAESGVPTFRDALTGHWARLDPMELASEPGYRADPGRGWRWYAERRVGVAAAQPNAGHHALAALAQRRPVAVVLVTQNVDNLHQRAGQPDTIRLHGDLFEDRWLDDCPKRLQGLACDTEWAAPAEPPRCAECGNLVRPGVVWFGESLPPQALQRAQAAAEACRVMLVVGTSGAVWPAAGLAELARRAGAMVVIVNPDTSEIDHQAQHLIRGTAARVLPELLAAL